MYKPAYFIIQELVDPEVYADRGEKAFELLDEVALITLDTLRENHGPVTVNNWHIGGDRLWSGLRTARSPYGTKYSQHRFGRAFDCLFKYITAEVVRQDILNNPNKYPFINSIELGVSWLHYDTRNCESIKTYNIYN